MAAPMLELVLLMPIVAYAYFLGQCLLPIFRLRFITTAGRIAASTSLGLGVVAYTVLLLGLLGNLTREPVLGTGALVLIAVVGTHRVLLKSRNRLSERSRSTNGTSQVPTLPLQSKIKNQ